MPTTTKLNPGELQTKVTQHPILKAGQKRLTHVQIQLYLPPGSLVLLQIVFSVQYETVKQRKARKIITHYQKIKQSTKPDSGMGDIVALHQAGSLNYNGCSIGSGDRGNMYPFEEFQQAC